MNLFLQDLVNGILAGGIFAVVALGFSLVWGIMNIINLAHGAYLMLGAYLAYTLFTFFHVDPFISIPLAFVALFILGYLVQRFIINYVVRAPILTTFLLTFGLSLLIINVALLIFHGDVKGITTSYSGTNFSLGPLVVSRLEFWGFVTLLVACIVPWLFRPRKAAESNGIVLDRLPAVVCGVAAGLIGTGLVLLALIYLHADPYASISLACIVLVAFVLLLRRSTSGFLEQDPILTSFLLALGVSLLIVNAVFIAQHGHVMGRALAYGDSVLAVLGPVTISWTKFWTLIAALLITACMHVFLTRTKTGRAIRATSMDIGAAQLSGVNVAHLYAIVYGLGAGLAGAAGVLVGLSYSLQPSMGDPFVIKGFVVCVLGGLGSVQGALIGGLVYGIVEAFGSQYIGSGLQDATALVVLLIVLIVRPRGIMGKAVA